MGNVFNQQALNFLALGTGLVREQVHPQHLGRDLASFFWRLADLDAAALTASPSVYLRLHHNTGGSVFKQRPGRVERIFAALHHLPARHGNAVLREDGFSLVLMYFHFCMMTAGQWRAAQTRQAGLGCSL